MSELSELHLEELTRAKRLLEHPGFAVKVTNFVGRPIEAGLERLPGRWQDKISEATRYSLLKASDVLSKSFDFQKQRTAMVRGHKLAAITSGAVGGAFGLAALTIELPISTMIMLRSIMDIARSEGEPVNEPQTRLACLEVFALGGRVETDDASETAYYTVRVALAKAVTEAAKYITQRGVVEETAPAIVRLIAQIASRFGIVVSEKAAAQALPVIGAVSGGAINAIFIDHFQNMARGHFLVRRLERVYSPEAVKEAYDSIILRD